MSDRTPIGPKDWLAAIVLGAGIGVALLGVGSRFAMRGVALLAGSPGGASVGGTATVVFLGLVAGVVAALVFVGLRQVFPRHRALRAGLFWLFLVLVTLRGLRPLDWQRLTLFMPLILLYGVGLHLLWCRVYLPRRSAIHRSMVLRPAVRGAPLKGEGA